MHKFGFGRKRLIETGLSIFGLSLLLAACGDPTQTSAPATAAPNTLAATTAASTTVAATNLVATTAAPTSVAATTAAPTTAAASSTTLSPFVATATARALEQAANPPTPTPVNPNSGPVAAPTITVGPTPVAQPPAKGWWSNGVCYEVFVRSFFDSNGDGIGDLPGLTSKLDYIKGLGANCIWLMPIQQSPSYHGYDTTDFYTVNKDYGTNDDFKKLMSEAHARGIYVLIDWVINHTSNQHPWFKESQTLGSPKRDWYIWSNTDPGYRGPWGDTAWWPQGANQFYYGVFDKSQPDLNFRNPDVTKEIYNATRFWLQDMGVDGFRLDAAKHLIEDGRIQIDTPETKAWLRDWQKYVKSLKADAFTVGEVNGPSLELNGFWPDQLDSYFEFGLADSFVKSITARSPNRFLSAINYAVTNWPFQRWSSFLTNHDQDRVIGQFQGDMSQMKLATTMLLTSPGLPFIYYGEELGAQGSKPDENIRTPMQWENSPTAGFTTGTPWIKPNNSAATANVAMEDKDPNSLLNFYRKLIKLRRDSPALSSGSWIPLSAAKDTTAAFIRQSQGETMMVVLNYDSNAVENPAFSLEKSELKAGQYNGQELLQDAKIAALTVGEGGSLKGVIPLPKVEPFSGYVIKLSGK